MEDARLRETSWRSERDSNPRSLANDSVSLAMGSAGEVEGAASKNCCPFFGGPKVSNPSQCRYDSLMVPTDVPPVGSLPKPSIMDNSYVLSK
jgi:hypothetical protein